MKLQFYLTFYNSASMESAKPLELLIMLNVSLLKRNGRMTASNRICRDISTDNAARLDNSTLSNNYPT